MHIRTPRGGRAGYAGLLLFNGVYPLKLHRMSSRVYGGRTGNAERCRPDVLSPPITYFGGRTPPPIVIDRVGGPAHAAVFFIYMAAPSLVVARRGITSAPRPLGVGGGGQGRGPSLPLKPRPPSRGAPPSFPQRDWDSGVAPRLFSSMSLSRGRSLLPHKVGGWIRRHLKRGHAPLTRTLSKGRSILASPWQRLLLTPAGGGKID